MASMVYHGKMKQVSLAQARDRLSILVNDAAHGGQRIVLASRGRPKAALIGMEDLARLERAETGTTTIEREMLHWIERVEDAQRHWPRAARSSKVSGSAGLPEGIAPLRRPRCQKPAIRR